MNSFSDVINQYPNYQALADDIKVSYGQVQQWFRRNSIPSEYWGDILVSATNRGLKIDCKLLITIASKKRK